MWSGAEAGYGDTMDLVVQQYKGEDVLTFFTGSFYSGGYGYGTVRFSSFSLALSLTSGLRGLAAKGIKLTRKDRVATQVEHPLEQLQPHQDRVVAQPDRGRE